MLDYATPSIVQDRSPNPGQFSLRDLLNGVFYYRRAALIVAGTVVALGIVAALLLPPTYNAEARLLPLSAGIYDMQDAGRTPQPGQVLDPAAVVNVELQMLASLELHRAVVRDQLGPAASPAEVNAGLERFESHLHVTKANEANVIQLTFAARDPQVAADTLHRLIARYFESRANVLTAGRVAFLEAQRSKVKTQLDQANAAITSFQERNGIVDIAAQVAGAVAQDDELRKSKLDTDATLADGRRSLATLRSGTGRVPRDVEVYSDNTEAARALGEMQASLLTLQAKRADLASRFMATAPQVVQVDKQIAAIQATIGQGRDALAVTRRTGRNQYFDSARDRLMATQASVDGAAARGGTLAAQLAQSGARLRRLNDIADQLAAMKLDRDVLADSFRSLSTQVAQSRVQLNQTTEAGSPSVREIEAPTPPAKRSNPPALLIAGSIVAAILLAGTTVFVLGSVREVFLSPMEVERALRLPVIAAPMIDDGDAEASERREYGRAVAAIDAGSRRAATSVLLLAPSSRRSLQTAALGLGRAIERRGAERVVLVRFAAGEPVPAGAAELAVEMYANVATAVIGTAAITSHRTDARLLGELKATYDYVVVTAPPLTDGFEGVELAQVVDHVVPVIEAEATRQPVAARLLVQVGEAGGTVLGAILLGRRSYIPGWAYRVLIERRWRRAG
jgi:uncharacterized protein involved in exopolysaccharide biosynthesis